MFWYLVGMRLETNLKLSLLFCPLIPPPSLPSSEYNAGDNHVDIDDDEGGSEF